MIPKPEIERRRQLVAVTKAALVYATMADRYESYKPRTDKVDDRLAREFKASEAHLRRVCQRVLGTAGNTAYRQHCLQTARDLVDPANRNE